MVVPSVPSTLLALLLLSSVVLGTFCPQSPANPVPESSTSNSLAEDPVIGIDLGTSYASVAIYQSGSVKVLKNRHGNLITPTCVAFANGQWLVGQDAMIQALSNPDSAVCESIRILGRLERTTQNAHEFPAESNLKRSQITIVTDGQPKTVAPEHISALIIAEMKGMAEQYLGQPVSRAVISVPVSFTHAQRQATKDASSIAGITDVRLMNGPTAAALAMEKSQERRTALIFDLGGGFLDVSIIEMERNEIEVVATAGDSQLGGLDFTNRLVDYFVNMHKERTQFDCTKDLKSMVKFRHHAEQTKLALSSQSYVTVEIPLDNGVFKETVSRATFENLCEDLFIKSVHAVRLVLKRRRPGVDGLVLMGGSSQIPKIQALVRSEVRNAWSVQLSNQDVTYGLALAGAMRGGHIQEQTVLERTPTTFWTIGSSMLFHQYTSLPAKTTRLFKAVTDPEHPTLITVYKDERTKRVIGQFELSKVPHSGEVVFELDVDGILHLSGVEFPAGNRKVVSVIGIRDTSRLSGDELDYVTREVKAFRDHQCEIRPCQEIEQNQEILSRNVRLSGLSSKDQVSHELALLITNVEKFINGMDSVIQGLDNDGTQAVDQANTRDALDLFLHGLKSLQLDDDQADVALPLEMMQLGLDATNKANNWVHLHYLPAIQSKALKLRNEFKMRPL